MSGEFYPHPYIENLEKRTVQRFRHPLEIQGSRVSLPNQKQCRREALENCFHGVLGIRAKRNNYRVVYPSTETVRHFPQQEEGGLAGSGEEDASIRGIGRDSPNVVPLDCWGPSPRPPVHQIDAVQSFCA